MRKPFFFFLTKENIEGVNLKTVSARVHSCFFNSEFFSPPHTVIQCLKRLTAN